MKKIKCRFCYKEAQINEKCSCGCINTSTVPQDIDQNSSFEDYSYNNYDSSVFKKIFKTWNLLNSRLFISNSKFLFPLKLIFFPILPVNFGINFDNKDTFYDVGCGRGDFIRNLPPRLKTFGTDIINYKITDLNIKIMNFEKNNNFIEYDIVRSSHSLEHSIKPKQFLNNLIKSVKGGGILFISTPNSDFWLKNFFGENWVPLNVLSHFCIFNQRCVEEYLIENGFTIIKKGTYSNISHIESFFKKYNLKLNKILFIILALMLYPIFIIESLLNIGDSIYLYAEKN